MTYSRAIELLREKAQTTRYSFTDLKKIYDNLIAFHEVDSYSDALKKLYTAVDNKLPISAIAQMSVIVKHNNLHKNLRILKDIAHYTCTKDQPYIVGKQGNFRHPHAIYNRHLNVYTCPYCNCHIPAHLHKKDR